VRVTPLGLDGTDQPLEPPLKDPGEWMGYRLIVEDGVATVLIDGLKIHERHLPHDADPWVAVCLPPGDRDAVRDLRITGQPEVPDAIVLSGRGDLRGWIPLEGEPRGNEKPAWEARGDEIDGRRLKDAPGSMHESTLAYHRPLHEDGTISYSFYYSPG